MTNRRIGETLKRLDRGSKIRLTRFSSRLQYHLGIKKTLRWWLVYGAVRTGTSLMGKMVSSAAVHYVGDWNLGDLLKLTPNDQKHAYIRFDRSRALRDISLNVIDNAYFGSGTAFDLAFKQANLDGEYFQILVEMWGKPLNKVFCFREPAGYMASACKKFPDTPLEIHRSNYVTSFEHFDRIGGLIFEYSDKVTKAHYIDFLSPHIPIGFVEQFGPEVVFRGKYASDLVTNEMSAAYQEFRQRYQNQIFPAVENAVR